MEKKAILSILHQIDAYDFESVIADLWERQGWDTHVTQGSNDMGIDVIAEQSAPFSQKIAIQAKRYEPSSSVSSTEVQQYASLRQQVDKVDAVVIVTTARFSAQAQKTADALNVKLVNGEQLYGIFESHDAFDILHQYLDISTTFDTSRTNDVSGFQADTTSVVSEPEILPVNYEHPDTDERNEQHEAAPDNLADVISLQRSLSDEFKRISEITDRAERAFETKDFDTTVKIYTNAQGELLNLQTDIVQYGSGFERIDEVAAKHLTSPDEFESELAKRKEQFERRTTEAEELAEQAEALEWLADKIEKDANQAKRMFEEGDRARNRGKYEKAKDQYDTAQAVLEEVQETLDTYHALAEEYERAISPSRPEPPTEVSLETLCSKLKERLDKESNRVVKRDFASEAIHASVTNARMTESHTGEGFTNKPAATYLDSGEIPHFAFHSSTKGYTIEDSDGSKTRHTPGSDYGSLYLITDHRILIITGHDDGDWIGEVNCPVLSEYSIGRLKNRLTLLLDGSDEGRKYHLWIDLAYHESALESAKQFLLPTDNEEQIETDANPVVPANPPESPLTEQANKMPDTLNGDRADSSITPKQPPSRIVNQASGSFSEQMLTKKDGRLIDQRLVDYLLPDEVLEYVLWHQYKGLRTIHPDGTEETPHHDTKTEGSRFLLITDREICYIAGLNAHDEMRTFDYSQITDVKATTNLTSQWITFTLADGTEYRFAETGTHHNDVTDAAEYIRTQI